MTMVSTDPVADMLTRIRNAILVNKNSVNFPYSGFKLKLAELLKDQGYIEEVSTEDIAGFKRIILTINHPGSNTRITAIKRMSKPGRRLYKNAHELPRSMSGRGIVVVSTSKGMMTDKEARKQNIGGELICEVY